MKPRKIRPLEERFWEKVDKDGPVPAYRPDLGQCWIWKACTSHGYGRIGVTRGSGSVAHRVSYELLVGPIPEKLVLDHLCRVTRCVNPAHLEPVTDRINLLRGFTLTAKEAATTHCPQGHPYDERNTYVDPGGMRHCRICRNFYAARAHQRAKERTPA